MKRLSSISRNLFPLVSFAGLLFVSTELLMQMLSSSLCGTEGCRVVAEHARYGDMAMLLPGIAAFLILALLSGINLFLHERRFDHIVNAVLIASITAEGFLVGYQAFRVNISCMFCLSVFAVFVILGIVRIMEGHRRVIAGFAGFAVIFSLFYLVLPAENNCTCIQDTRLVLFSSEGCSHCETVKELCRNCDLQINEIPAEEHAGLLRKMNIDEVPVLLVNDKTEKRILIGEARIKEYLSNTNNNQESSVWMPEIFSSTAHADTCRPGKQCRN